jgi:hypothetical protein
VVEDVREYLLQAQQLLQEVELRGDTGFEEGATEDADLVN